MTGTHVSPLVRRRALFAAFFFTGVAVATWVSRTPDIRDGLDVRTDQLGLVIMALSIGSMVGISLGGPVTVRRGARLVVAGGLAALVVGLLVVALGAGLGSPWVVAAGLASFGAGMGAGEIGQNVEAVAVEAELERTIVPSMHGCFSLGIFAGALVGIAANAGDVAVPLHIGAVGVVLLLVSAWVVTQLPAATGRDEVVGDVLGDAPLPAAVPKPWKERRTILLGVVVLGMALAEGSANDWLPLIVVDGFDLSAATGALVYAFFGLAMAIGRFSGGWFLDRFGRAPVMRTSAALAFVGIALVAFGPGPVVGSVGVLLWGLGAALGFPVALSAAGDDPVGAARRVSVVATAGYTAFLVGPPLLGFVGEEVGLRLALVVVLVAVLGAAFAAGAARKPTPVRA